MELSLPNSIFEQSGLLEGHYLVRALLENSPDCIKLLDLDGRLLYMSNNCRLALGIEDFAPLMGQDWLELWAQETRPAVAAAIHVAREGGRGRFQGFFATLKGIPKWWDVIVTAVHGRNGQPEHLLVVSRDISALRQTQSALAASEGRYQAALDQAGLGIAHVSLTGRYLMVSDSFCAMLGYDRASLLQLGFAEDHRGG